MEVAFIFPAAIVLIFVVLIVWWAIQGDTGN
jgi:hypothetical protein